MTAGPWGPFTPGLDWPERKARLRSLRALVRVLTGPRGKEAAYRLLVAEISADDPEALDEAASAFDQLGTVDRRRVLASFIPLLVPPSRSPT